MKQYHDLLKYVLENGVEKSDRTGTGTKSVFGYQMRFDLQEGFPLVTTKKMYFHGTVGELLWFLRGDTNINWLLENNIHFWDEWSDEDGSLGPVYGEQFRNIESFVAVTPKIFEPSFTNTVLEPLVRGKRNLNERTVFGVGYYGDYDKTDQHYSWLVNIWRDMLRRCYHKEAKGYKSYGAKGYHVSERWHCFANFQKDVKRIPGWENKLEYFDTYSLDKDSLYASNRYDVSTCQWAHIKVQNANLTNSNYFSALSPDGERVEFYSIGQMSVMHNMNISAIHRCLNGQLKTHHNWSNFKYLPIPDDKILRYQSVDQLANVIASIKHNPDSRRHVISLWNPSQIDRMNLPPCHGNIIQFYVADGKLSCHMYQRSGDIFLGVPHNIASYALLTHMVAHVTGLEVGEFIHTIGDAHLYLNHIDQARLQLTRTPKDLPRLQLNPDIKDIDDFTFGDIVLLDYKFHPPIKAKVAV